MEPGCSISTITGSDKRDAFRAQRTVWVEEISFPVPIDYSARTPPAKSALRRVETFQPAQPAIIIEARFPSRIHCISKLRKGV